jgi:predicted transcriptional regulator
MANSQSRATGPAQAARPSAAEAKVTEERYRAFQNRMDRLAEAARKAGRSALGNALVDLGQRVEDREITLDEGLAELRHYEGEIRSMLKR